MSRSGSLKIVTVMPLGDQTGGAEILLLDLLDHSRMNGVSWTVVYLRDGPLLERTRALGHSVHLIPAGRFRQPHLQLRAAWTIARLVRREQAHLVLGWMSAAQAVAGLAAVLARVPSIWFQWGLPTTHWLDRLATMTQSRGILTCSRAAAEAQAQLRPRRPIGVVYPGIDLQRFDPDQLPDPVETRRRLGLPLGVPLIGIVGRLQRWKGMHVLVQAMASVRKRHPTVRCLIVGGVHALEPDYPDVLARLIADLGLEETVQLAGLQRNVPEWMQAMDVVVHASDREPFGLVVIEAMALGKPVVAGDSGGPTEVITQGVDGLLTPYGDAEALAAALLRYLDQPDFRDRAGRAARIRAADFSVQQYVNQFFDEVQRLVPELRCSG